MPVTGAIAEKTCGLDGADKVRKPICAHPPAPATSDGGGGGGRVGVHVRRAEGTTITATSRLSGLRA